MAKSKYEAVPPLSTVKGLDPALEKVLRPMRNYVNALIGGTGAKLPIKVELQDADMSSGFISERILGDASVVTRKVVDDNITRVWSYNSDADVNLPEFIPATTFERAILTYTASFTPTASYEMMIWGFLQAYAASLDDVTDIITFEVGIVDNIEIVCDTVFKWTASGSGTNEYYLTNEAGNAMGLSACPEFVFEDAVAGGGDYLVKATAGTLAAGEWAYADNDTLGFSTIYVRLTDNTDPDGKTDGYVRAGFQLEYYHSPYFNGYMIGASDTIADLISIIHLHSFTDTKKRSLAMVGSYRIIAGALAAASAYIDAMAMVVLERRGK